MADLPLSAIEAALARDGMSVSRLLRRADLAESTWHRWKKEGRTPRGKSLERLIAALDELLDPETRRALAIESPASQADAA